MMKNAQKYIWALVLFMLSLLLVGCHEHAYGEWTVENAATCTDCGVEVRSCVCGLEETREAPTIAHTYGEWVITAVSHCDVKGSAQRVCLDCGAVEAKELELDSSRHRYGQWNETKAATCLEAGSKTRQCACGTFETIVIKKLEHDVVIDPAKDPTTDEVGLTEGSHCSQCQTVLVPQQTVDKLEPSVIDVLDGVRYQGDTTGALIFYWDVAQDYVSALETIRVTVDNGTAQDSYEIAASATYWAYQVTGEQATYTFTFEPVADVAASINSVTSEFYWMPQLLELNFPRFEITTQNGELPTFDKVAAPEGYWGAGITNAEYVQSMISLYDSNDVLLYSSVDKGFDGAKIKVRGNTSAYAKKTPFKIKLDKKADLLAGLVDRAEDTDYRDKNWVLLAGGNSLNTAVGFEISELVGMDWTPAYTYVALFVNGEYRGVYILAEGVEQSEARCDVSDSGYVIEMDAYWWNEDLYFSTPISENSPAKYTFKYPDPEDFDESSQAYLYIKQYMTDLENALVSGGDISQYMDLQTFAKWLLVHDILATYDSGGSNIYLTKYDDTASSTVRMGPAWDFDTIGWNNWSDYGQLARIRQSAIFYMPYLIQNQQFSELYADAYAAVGGQVVDLLETELAQYNSDAYGELIACDDLRWRTNYVGSVPAVEEILAWFEAHLAWMDENV